MPQQSHAYFTVLPLLTGVPVRTTDTWVATVRRQMQIVVVSEHTAQDGAPRGARL